MHPRKVNYDELQRIKDFPIFKRGKYRGGFIAEQQYIRFTPHGNLAYRTIGLMNKGAYGGVHGSIGVSGIEAAITTLLSCTLPVLILLTVER